MAPLSPKCSPRRSDRLAGAIVTAAVGLVIGAMAAARAEDGPRFSPPVGCLENGRCFIQNYVDLDPGPGFKDYRCGHLTYNNHKGTDFAVRDLQAMRDGEPVLAAAPGKVLRTRDGEPDGVYDRKDPSPVKGRECGNGAIIAHGNGWIAKYCHMRQGSVVVKPGDIVQRGDTLGLIGMSGQAEFPHVHIGLYKNNQVIDPFSGPRSDRTCESPDQSQWFESAAPALTYRLTEPVKSGYAGRNEDVRPAVFGEIGSNEISRISPLIISWSTYKGALPGDRMSFHILAPNGETIGKGTTQPLNRKRARHLFAYVLKRKNLPWPSGIYTSHVRLLRRTEGAEQTVYEDTYRLTIR
jgi:hypothetical protein